VTATEQPPEHSSSSEVFAEDGIVVAPKGAALPRRCIKCNRPAGGKLIGITFVDSATGGAPRGAVSGLVHFATRRSGKVYVSLCSRHLRLRKWIRRGSFILALLAVSLLTWSVIRYGSEESVLTYVGMVLLLTAGFAFGVYQQHYLKSAGIRGGLVRIAGPGPEFLASLRTGPGT